MSKYIYLLGITLLLSMVTMAQEVPKAEVSVGYSYVNLHPNLDPITSQNLNGGGGAFVYNVTSLFGIKADFQGYTLGSSFGTKLHDAGYVGSVNGNLFTYMFGPQIKKHSGKLQPFGEALFGAAHSNGYASFLKAEQDGTYQIANGGSNNNAFAMEFGGGLDFALTKNVQIRPVEVDYLLTRFGYRNYSANQNNFKYFAGVNFTFGGK